MLKNWIDRRIEIVFQEMTLESFSCQALSWFPVTRGLRLMCTQLVMEEVVAVGREASGGELQCRADPHRQATTPNPILPLETASNLGLNVR